ncbi:MAG: DUF4384 domain-containing protein [Vulcanibacillus sp.]
MKKLFTLLLFTMLPVLISSQSVIVESEGIASMGDTKSRKETISDATNNAKKHATENAGTYLKSETVIKNYITEQDVLETYSQAIVKIIEIISGEWFKDSEMGDCYRIAIKAEVIPNFDKMENIINDSAMIDDPTAPLTIKIWTNNKDNTYRKDDKIKIYLKGNKPFYARVVYNQLDGSQVQILPNPFRKDNYFNGSTIYELPSGKDQYALEITPPYGKEDITVYASTEKLGDVKLTDTGNLYVVNENREDTKIKTRGLKIVEKNKKSGIKAAEFFETKVEITTEK